MKSIAKDLDIRKGQHTVVIFLYRGIAAFQTGHSELRRHAINHREVIIIGSEGQAKILRMGVGIFVQAVNKTS